MTGEQVIEAVMTNVVVRILEVLIAPLLVWWKASRLKKEWPKPILIGFILVVTASCLFLEEKITALVRYATYDEERVIRAWLDELHLQTVMSTTKEEVFRLDATGHTQLSVYRKRSSPGVITFSSGIRLSTEEMSRIQQLPVAERKHLESDIYLELSRHELYPPVVELKDNEIMNLWGMESDFEFSESSPRSVLDEQFRKVTSVRRVVQLVLRSWIAQGKL